MEASKKVFRFYLWLVSLSGVVLLIWSLVQVPAYEQALLFFLLLGLAIFGQFLATSVAISSKAGVTYQITPAVALAAVPMFGPSAAILIDAAAAISIWLLKSENKTTWKRSWSQLAFNTGMNSVAMFAAGFVLQLSRSWLGAETILGASLPWLLAALTNDQVNLWLLSGILYLQHERQIPLFNFWRQNLWAVPISVLLMTFGGALIAFALDQYGWLGAVIFFLPIVLSGYAFRLYIRQVEEHMRQLEEMVEERTAELAASNQRKAALMAVLTHDMITPLTSTQLYAELIKADPQVVLDNPHLIDFMLHSQNTLMNLVQNILDIDRLQTTGSLPLNKEEFDLNQSIRNTVGMVQAMADEKQIRIGFQLPDQPLIIDADRLQIERVLLNLLSNAVKYTPGGGQVDAVAQYQNGQVSIAVHDTGYGIAAEELPRLFKRYHDSEQKEKKVTGTGLGLTISKVIVENHQGQISVDSQEGQGSHFTVTLPAR